MKPNCPGNKSSPPQTRPHPVDGGFIGCALPADASLLEQGWEKRFMADSRMAREAVETYGALGYEVKLEPLSEDAMRDECSGCKAILRQFSIVYTRKKKSD